MTTADGFVYPIGMELTVLDSVNLAVMHMDTTYVVAKAIRFVSRTGMGSTALNSALLKAMGWNITHATAMVTKFVTKIGTGKIVGSIAK